MSDETFRARRALQPDEELQAPLVPDDTAAADAARPRRGAAAPEESTPAAGLGDDPVEPVAPTEPTEPAGPAEPIEPAAPAAPARGQGDSPFTRRGSVPFSETPPPVPVAPEPEPMIPAPVFPRSAGEYADGPGPAPRRSAMSSDTPVEVERPAAPAAAPSWVSAHKMTLGTWALAGLVGALVVGLIAFFVVRGMQDEPSGVPSGPESPTSGSPSVTDQPADVADLVEADDLVPIAPAGDWSVISTTETQSDHTMRAICLSTAQPTVNPTHSFQRTLGTSGDDKLATLHRIDVYANVDAASSVMSERIASLTTCGEVPARLVRGTTIEGLAEETFQVTIVQEEAVAKYHTVLLTRDGAALQMVDVARDAQPVDENAVADSLLRSQADLAEAQDAPGPTDVTAAPAIVPPAPPEGWLVPIDLPRIHPGAGRWTMTGPHPVDGTNMGCENMELATEAGPTERQRTAYALTRDEKIPERFGIDELLFTFPSSEEAAVFVTKLGTNLRTCGQRVLTAEIAEHAPVPAKDAEGNALSSLVFTATQAISDTEKVTYQLIVSVATNKVAYTIISATPEVQFTQEQLTELAARISVRASQLN
ncbi:hypothetical protein H5392_12020 [Tessaracoccus sp. MC1865]|uniref:hypothetical protein n=1 Tax=Tessaracoccus sp. MC1865 TaxID=2760310 RepID=UPI0015FEC74B|nr:hypothetical protein [Tessaracoccus sp. MC1865]MBB1484580.1 hypothetical protein [Tessaracoccus sp. MC1865]QTO38331.1 hypothetical protein J7D54_04315 [Tessaracoccus sp. MC1865]